MKITLVSSWLLVFLLFSSYAVGRENVNLSQLVNAPGKYAGRDIAVSGYFGIISVSQGWAGIFTDERHYLDNLKIVLAVSSNKIKPYLGIKFKPEFLVPNYELYQGKNYRIHGEFVHLAESDLHGIGFVIFDRKNILSMHNSSPTKNITPGGLPRKIFNLNNEDAVFSGRLLQQLLHEARSANNSLKISIWVKNYTSKQKTDAIWLERAKKVMFFGKNSLQEKFQKNQLLFYYAFGVEDASFQTRIVCACSEKDLLKNPRTDYDFPFPITNRKAFCITFTNYFDLNTRSDNWTPDFFR